MSKKLSRRDFFKRTAVGAAGVAAIGLTGCGTTSSTSTTGTKADWLPEVWDYETDVLVIGYGGAGVWAALTARDEGNSEVLILEKAPTRGGGNSSINLGEFTIIKDKEAAYTYIKEFTKGKTPDAVIRAWVEECARNVEYCERWNIPYIEQTGTLASGYKENCEYPFLLGAEGLGVYGIKGLGMNFWKIMDQHRKDLGIEVIWEANNEELIQNPETKEIVGCYTYIGYEDKKKYAIKARKGVIMTIGGFEFNDELKREYLKIYPHDGFYGWPFNTGDGIYMVTKVGAKLWHMDCVIGGANFNAHDPEVPFAMSVRPKGNSYIHVNNQGKRWHDETERISPHTGWHAYEGFNEEICDFDHVPSWTILDHAALEAGPMGPKPGGALSRGMYGSDLPDELYGAWGRAGGWSDDNSVEIEKGWILKADTLEELAEKIRNHDYGCKFFKTENLVAAVQAFNSYAGAGEDKEFGRDPATMAKLEKPPFYAFPVFPGGCSTLGGPEKNERGEVIDWEGKPIKRFYAAGCFGNMAGHTYGISGGNNAENMVFGRICGRNCAALEPWDKE